MTKDQCCVLKHLTAGDTGGFDKTGEMDDNEFLNALIGKGLVWILDWAGEDETGDVGEFISSRLEALQSGVSLDCDKIYARLEKEAKKEGFERGDASLFLMNEFQKALKRAILGSLLWTFITTLITYLSRTRTPRKILKS